MSTVLDSRLSRSRPSRADIEPAALDLVRRHGAQIMSVARRYSATPEDAEDAYQRGLEILLTKAPSTDESDLVPWLKTVVKHEAFAIRRQRNRHGLPTEPDEFAPVADRTAATHERAERYERLQVGAEALGRLKPQEVRALLLLAEGYSYKQIQEITGWTYTKVNRCLAEGRRAFLQRVDGIESGEECARVAPLISAFADGEASEVDAAAVRRHLRGCLSCRAALRESREAPARVAALAPAGLLFAPGARRTCASRHPGRSRSRLLPASRASDMQRPRDQPRPLRRRLSRIVASQCRTGPWRPLPSRRRSGLRRSHPSPASSGLDRYCQRTGDVRSTHASCQSAC